jgi:hypothetical protein
VRMSPLMESSFNATIITWRVGGHGGETDEC